MFETVTRIEQVGMRREGKNVKNDPLQNVLLPLLMKVTSVRIE